ncbi:M1 family metallopeptidase [Brevibacillus formosus]|uniref:Peptidase n=1 Tax=Brevibacillus formosus TaxID=54913 RepID=A0A837KIJ0_9BACL|nr:M1 family metallopeptidase [Brevibacillus formosus]KLH97570.1 aminopeptidase N [Brevibacillus formosus]MED1955466.1 M1 family metallopeptidase [Brevibacillus formosus]PSJ95256.1 aminopeptidase [Brevibacillus formosus]GED61445.1 peptidase [Brevibacillus formosus]
MKKWVSMVGCSLLFLTWMLPVNADEGTALTRKPLYRANVRIDPIKKEVAGTVTITFWPKDPTRAYLHLYPNVFTEEHQGMLWEELLGNGPTLGSYTNKKLLVDGVAVVGKQTKDLNILEVPLEGQKGPRKIVMEFEMTLPRNDGRMSYDDQSIWLGNWLPVLAVYDKEGWHLDPYEPVGDPFYSENADYDVNVTLPKDYQLASTAPDRAAKQVSAGEREKTIQLCAENVRDFALVVMDASYQRTETKVGETVVRTWWRKTDDPATAAQIHEAAAESLAYFHHQLGAYPYSEFDVVRTGGAINGMEYPALVFLDGRHFFSGEETGIVTVVHETAHQWFYGLLGNNQVKEAWLDEGFTEYVTLSYLFQQDPLLGAERVRRRLEQGTSVQYYVAEELRPWQALSAFPNNQSYSDLVYSRPSSMLWLLQGAWGEERVHDVLKQYVEKYRYQVVTGKEWEAFLSEMAGENASAFLDYWLRVDMSKQEQAAAWLERQRLKHQKK